MELNDIIDAIGVEPFHREEAGVIYCADCLDILPKIPAGAIDLVLTDPPYGIGLDTSYDKFKNSKQYQTIEGDDVPFDPRPLLQFYSCPMILWGGNCFADRLPRHTGWLAWFKTGRNGAKIRQAEMELAWTNFIARPQAYRLTWIGAYREGETRKVFHPTQKPIELIRWCIELGNGANTILDPFLGSGTTAVACKELGRKFIGIEIEEKYCHIAVDRLRQGVLAL
jgi:site-specific DNA-methyltransferase (adenine-specific)